MFPSATTMEKDCRISPGYNPLIPTSHWLFNFENFELLKANSAIDDTALSVHCPQKAAPFWLCSFNLSVFRYFLASLRAKSSKKFLKLFSTITYSLDFSKFIKCWQPLSVMYFSSQIVYTLSMPRNLDNTTIIFAWCNLLTGQS